jgi:hypothetical protein
MRDFQAAMGKKETDGDNVVDDHEPLLGGNGSRKLASLTWLYLWLHDIIL